jgi:hypothetical protein
VRVVSLLEPDGASLWVLGGDGGGRGETRSRTWNTTTRQLTRDNPSQPDETRQPWWRRREEREAKVNRGEGSEDRRFAVRSTDCSLLTGAEL